jgi:hypothetical protein
MCLIFLINKAHCNLANRAYFAIFKLFSNSYEFLMIDCRLNSFRNGKRLDRAMGHIFQWPSPAVGYAA